jgi:hypothetical protein
MMHDQGPVVQEPETTWRRQETLRLFTRKMGSRAPGA